MHKEFTGKIFSMRTVFWEDNQLKMIDQRILPARFEVVSYSDHKSVARAITDMVVRGAPAIGAAAAFGMALAGYESTSSSSRDLLADLMSAASTLNAARPTAVNLAWAVDRIMGKVRVAEEKSVDELRQLDERTLLGMTAVDLGPLRRIAFPFTLQSRVSVDGL